MPVQKVLDSNGNSMLLYVHEKKPQYFSSPLLNVDMVENMPDQQLRHDDIMLCSYPKAGCHWVWDIIRMLLKGTTTVDAAMKESCMMEYPVDSEFYGKVDIEDLPSPRVLNNHQHFENQPKDVLDKKIKVVFVYRNPKDVAVSFYHHHKKIDEYQYSEPDFASYLPRFTDGLVDYGCIYDYLRDWERGIKQHKDLNICVLCYEQLQKNPFPEVQRLSSFLGQGHGEEFIRSVVEAASIDNMRKAKVTGPGGHSGREVMYRKGKVGDWKNHFTVAHSEWFDHVTRSRMGDSKMFNFIYSL